MILFAEISDTVQLAIVAGIFAALAAVVTMVSTLATMVVKELLIDRPAREAAKVAAQKVEATLTVSNEKNAAQMAEIATDGKKTLHLVNSAMEEQKRIYMVKCEAASATDPTPVNIAEAKAAREAYEEHKVKQQAADTKEQTK